MASKIIEKRVFKNGVDRCPQCQTTESIRGLGTPYMSAAGPMMFLRIHCLACEQTWAVHYCFDSVEEVKT